MANEIVAARTVVKTKLDIVDTTFDTMLLECLKQAVRRLSPWVKYVIPEDVTVTLDAEDQQFTLPTSGSDLEKLYARQTSNDKWRLLTGWRQSRDEIYLFETSSSALSLKIIAKRKFANSDADFVLLDADYPNAMLPLYLFAMAEFATTIVGNKRKFNIYQQTNGSRTLAEMRELVEFYETRAIRILEDEISAEGQ